MSTFQPSRAWMRHLGRFGVVLCLGFAFLLLPGCATPKLSVSSEIQLAERLQSLGPSVARADATLASHTAHTYSLQLAREYRAVRPAIVHNVLVNLRLKQRGLCFQWADDLSAKLTSLNLKTIELHRAVARLETRREHSALVLTAVGQPFDQGVVLDAWRHSGRLHWGCVSADKYPWMKVEVIPDDRAPLSLRTENSR